MNEEIVLDNCTKSPFRPKVKPLETGRRFVLISRNSINLHLAIQFQVLKLLQGDVDVTKWARQQINALEGCNTLDDEVCTRSDIQSHLNLALLDVDDDSLSLSSIEQSISLEDYLQGRWSRSSSFD